jgi:hypothetical protein
VPSRASRARKEAERRQTLIDSGILTETGEPHERDRPAIGRIEESHEVRGRRSRHHHPTTQGARKAFPAPSPDRARCEEGVPGTIAGPREVRGRRSRHHRWTVRGARKTCPASKGARKR